MTTTPAQASPAGSTDSISEPASPSTLERTKDATPGAAPSARLGRAGVWALAILTTLTGITVTGAYLADASGDLLSSVTPLLQWLPALSVLLAAVIVRPERLRHVIGISPLRPWRRSVGGSLLTVALVGLVALTTAAVGSALGIVAWRVPDGYASLLALVVPFLALALLLCFGEEVLWRGLLQAAFAKFGFWASSGVISAIWSLWHLPAMLVYASAGVVQGREVAATLINILAAGLLLSAARVRFASLWPAVAGHAAVNTFLPLVASNFLAPSLAALSDAGFWAVTALGWVALGAVTAGLRRGAPTELTTRHELATSVECPPGRS